MKFTVHLLWRAERDLDHIMTWLNERSPRGAANWLRTWDRTLAILESSADEYGWAPENEDQELESARFCFTQAKARNYRALYTIDGTCVDVMHIRAPGQGLVHPNELSLQK